MSSPDPSIQYLMDVIRIHRQAKLPTAFVPSLSGDQRQYLDEIGFSYKSCEPFCCQINLPQ